MEERSTLCELPESADTVAAQREQVGGFIAGNLLLNCLDTQPGDFRGKYIRIRFCLPSVFVRYECS